MKLALALIAVGAGVLTASVLGQAPGDHGQRPTFEVASVKPSPPGQAGGVFEIQPGGRMVAHNLALSSIIGLAYGKDAGYLRPDELAGEPAWTPTTRYDVEAKVAGMSSADAKLTAPEVSSLLKTLLQDRFKISAHVESRMLPMYALVLARADGGLGPRLHHSSLTCTHFDNSLTDVPAVGSTPTCGTRVVDGALNAGAMLMENLSRMLENALGRQAVTDETGLVGTFDVDLRWTPASTTSSADAQVSTGPSIFTAVQEQLGLRLEARRAPRDVVVIDHIERPTED